MLRTAIRQCLVPGQMTCHYRQPVITNDMSLDDYLTSSLLSLLPGAHRVLQAGAGSSLEVQLLPLQQLGTAAAGSRTYHAW
jgi:hypothetical protein